MAANAQTRQPKTVRDFFNLLPQEYFDLAGCGGNPTKENCNRARVEYLKAFLDIEDTANGYMSGKGEAGQGGFDMALFKRPDGTYIIGLTTWNEMSEDSYFLKYASGKWLDIGAHVVPGYGKDKTYLQPRYGRAVEVYVKKIEDGASERGRKLYDLVWRGGSFTIKKRASTDSQKRLASRFGGLDLKKADEDSHQYRLLFNGKEILQLEGYPVDVLSVLRGADRDYVIVTKYSGGVACPVVVIVVELFKSGPLAISEEFGSCSDLIKAKVVKGRVIIEMPTYTPHPEYLSKKELRKRNSTKAVYTWHNGKLSKRTLPG